MKRYIYNRVSSEAQDYEQQQHCISEYFKRIGIDPAGISGTIVEKVSGTVNHKERKLSNLIETCKAGDIIYISELSRLGRSMSDLFSIITECCNNGITVIQCKDGTQIENNSIIGKELLFAFGLAAEIEVMSIRQRTQMAMDFRKKYLEENGFFMNKRNERVTHLGQEKGYKMNEAREAAYEVRAQKKMEWREQSPAYNWVRDMVLDGKDINEIFDGFQRNAKTQPDIYCKRSGKPMDIATLYIWKREITEAVRVESMAGA